MSPIAYYTITLVFFFFAYCVLGWGLNLQFGEAGILNFAYIAFVALGAYVTGVTSSGPPAAGSGQSYILGATLPFPVGLVLGGLASCLLAVVLSTLAFRRLRTDYLAMVMISASLVLYDIINNYVPLFDGADGLSSVPQPFAGVLNLNSNSFIPFFTAVALVITLIMWWIVHKITHSPMGRTLRAIRDDADAAAALGKNVFKSQFTALLIGAFFAGIGGGLIIEFTSSFNTSAWLPGETFLIFAALIVGGLANNKGAIVGALIVPVLFTELPKLLPDIPGHPGLIEYIDAMAIGILLMVVLWFRPQGIVPVRARRSKPRPGLAEGRSAPPEESRLVTGMAGDTPSPTPSAGQGADA